VPPKVNISVGSVKAKKEREVDADDSDDDGAPRKAYYRKRNKN
jgi:ATP-dependent RNA helicase DDX18/HAS1